MNDLEHTDLTCLTLKRDQRAVCNLLITKLVYPFSVNLITCFLAVKRDHQTRNTCFFVAEINFSSTNTNLVLLEHGRYFLTPLLWLCYGFF